MPAPAVPCRDRPVLEHIVEQHAEEAAFLWTLRDAATDAPHYKRHHLARLDERVEAHVDGLRVAGEAGWRIALEQLERRCEKGELFAAGVLALESGDMRRVEPLVARAEAEPEARRGFVGAIAWCRPEVLAGTVRVWGRSEEGFCRYLALCACSVHRAHAGLRLSVRFQDDDALVRGRALRLAGETGRAEFLEPCLDQLHDGGGEAGFWAAWSAVLLGDRGSALRALRSFALADAPRRWSALELATRAAGLERGAEFIRTLGADPATRRAAVAAVGHLGDPAAVPWLIDRMSVPELARLAAESFATITGSDLELEGLELDASPEDPAQRPAADAGGERPAAQSDAWLPLPALGRVRAWYERARPRFAAGIRHLLGRPIEAETCVIVWQSGFQRQRRAAAYEQSLLAAAEPLWNWRAGN